MTSSSFITAERNEYIMGQIGEEFHIGEVVPLKEPAVPDFVPEDWPTETPAEPVKEPIKVP